MKTVTVDQILEMGPCAIYTRERLEELRKSVCGKRKKITAFDISKTDIPYSDKIWVLFRNEFFTDEQLHKIGLFAAEKIALPIWKKQCPGDDRIANVIRVKKLWIKGKATDEELRNARAYAAYAAYAADASARVYAAEAVTCAGTCAVTCAYAAYAAANAAGDASTDAYKKIITYALRFHRK